MSKSEQAKKTKATKITEFDAKTIVFPFEPKIFKKNKFIQKGLEIRIKANEEEEPRTLSLVSLENRFSFGLKGFGKGGWSVHVSVGPPRGSEQNWKEYKNGTKELKVLKAISKKIKDRVSQEVKDREFLFLRESEDEENNKEYSLYSKMIPNQTRIRIGKKTYKTERDYASMEGRALEVKGFGIEFSKVSVCPKVVSVRPTLGFLIAEFKTEEGLQEDWGSLIEDSEESEEEKED